MIDKLNTIIHNSAFKYWAVLERNFGYAEKTKGALKQRVIRAVKFLNKTLEPLGYQITIIKL